MVADKRKSIEIGCELDDKKNYGALVLVNQLYTCLHLLTLVYLLDIYK